MASIKDQLLKAGLVSKKAARKAGAEKRAERLAEGKQASDVADEAERRRLALYEAKLAEQQTRDQEHESRRQQEQQRRDSLNRLTNLVSAHALPLRGGDRRWYFVCRDGVIRWLAVPEVVGQRLEGGSAAVIEDPRGATGGSAFVVVAQEAAEACSEALPDHVLFWFRRARP